MSTSSRYTPGVCNINPVEIRRRRIMGHVMAAVAILLSTALILFSVPWYLHTLPAVAVGVAAFSYFQAHDRFCAAYALAGKQHADDGNVVAVTDIDAKKADQKHAAKLALQAVAIALVTAALLAVIAY